jgi:hypothetical protein
VALDAVFGKRQKYSVTMLMPATKAARLYIPEPSAMPIPPPPIVAAVVRPRTNHANQDSAGSEEADAENDLRSTE